MLAVALVVSIVGVHYEHPQHHFVVELPNAWQPVDQQEDQAGVVFQRNTNDRLTLCTIRAVPVAGATLQDFVLAIAAASQGEPGYRSVASGPTTLGGAAGYRRRFTLFIDPDGQFSKTVEERVAVVDGIGYVVRVEGFTLWFNRRARDVAQIFETFSIRRPGASTSRRTQPCPF